MRCSNPLCLIFCIKRKILNEYNLYSEIIAYAINLCYITKVINYRQLGKLLNECDVKKKDIMATFGMSQLFVIQTVKNDSVNTELLARICQTLNCGIGDVVDIVLPESHRA